MNYFTSKIDTIRYTIVIMPPSATVLHQIYRSPEEQFHSFSTIGEEELYKRVKSSKPTTSMLDPIPSKLNPPRPKDLVNYLESDFSVKYLKTQY